jgi:hypothetical protein
MLPRRLACCEKGVGRGTTAQVGTQELARLMAYILDRIPTSGSRIVQGHHKPSPPLPL